MWGFGRRKSDSSVLIKPEQFRNHHYRSAASTRTYNPDCTDFDQCVMEFNRSLIELDNQYSIYTGHHGAAAQQEPLDFSPSAVRARSDPKSTLTFSHEDQDTLEHSLDADNIQMVVIKTESDLEVLDSSPHGCPENVLETLMNPEDEAETGELEDDLEESDDVHSFIVTVKIEPDEEEPCSSAEALARCYAQSASEARTLEEHREGLNLLANSRRASTPRSCSECGKTFSTSSSFYRHMRIHSGEKRLHCSQCDKTFSQASSFKIHMRSHTGERPYQCHACGKTFTRLDNLQIHQRTHTGEKPYGCAYCPKTFTRVDVLQNHQRTHTGVKPYQCSHCGKTFTRLSVFQIHQRTHTGERPYACGTCGKRFRDASNLKNHERIHTEERPYRCSLCDKTFIQLGHLTSHHRKHTGEKPYRCSLCGKCYTASSTLLDHQRTHALISASL